MLKVTFDSNVWRIVASPSSFPNEAELASFIQINDSIKNGAILATLAETVFTLEAIKKSGRQKFLSDYNPEIKNTISELPDGTIKCRSL